MYTLKAAREYAAFIFLQSPFLKADGSYSKKEALTDADVLASHLIKKNRAWLLAHPGFDFSAFKKEFEHCVSQRAAGLAVAYITGVKEFYALPFFVNPSVLIPKPDTEILVEKAVKFAKTKINCCRKFFYADICTGSGCIAVSVLNELKNSFSQKNHAAVLSDISGEALSTAQLNAKKLLPYSVFKNMYFEKADLRKTIPLLQGQKYKLITANPPYVPSALTEELLRGGRGEPKLALDGGKEGLDLIAPLAQSTPQILDRDGKIFCEIGEYHASAALELFKKAGFKNACLHKDFSDAFRLIEAGF